MGLMHITSTFYTPACSEKDDICCVLSSVIELLQKVTSFLWQIEVAF